MAQSLNAHDAVSSAGADTWSVHQAASLRETAKRQRACDSCRNAKVRCMPSSLHTRDSSCQRCMRTDRMCITSPPVGPRKKRKQAINRVNELEKKIDLLAASLHRRDVVASPIAGQISPTADRPSVEPCEERAGERVVQEEGNTVSTPRADLATDSTQHGPIDIDIVRRCLISADDADKLLVRYNTDMIRHLPAVVIPSNLNALELRKTKPMVFLAIMAAAAYDDPAIQQKLVHELTQAFAHRIIVAAEKSLELVQALQISILWYWPPDHYEELQIYQLGQICITMAVEIGLGRSLPEKKPYARHAFRRRLAHRDTANTDPSTLEARRAWLTCYYLASNMTVTMQRPLALTWTRFMTESYEMLRTSADRAPGDEYFCALIWTHRSSEEAAQLLAGDDLQDPASALHIAYSLRKANQDLTQLRTSLSDDLVQETLAITLASLPLYMHGVVLDYDAIEDTQQQSLQPASSATNGFVPHNARVFSAADIHTVSCCLQNVRIVTDTFFGMDTDTIRSLPAFTFGRVVIASAMLFRIYVFVDQDSNLGAVIDKHELDVGLRIEKLVRQFRMAAEDRRCRPAARFLAVLLMIKNAFVKYCEYQGPGKQHESRGQDLPVTTTEQRWPQLHQQQQQQQPLSQPQGHGHHSTIALIQPDTPIVPSVGGSSSDLVLPWNVNFFAQSTEEFAYSLGLISDSDYLTGYQNTGDFGLSLMDFSSQNRGS